MWVNCESNVTFHKTIFYLFVITFWNSDMRRLCPSLTELQAFEATARHLNFTRAAVELFVTQGAVSRQVANLEVYLGVAVFTRAHQRLELSEAGLTYLPSVRKALNQLETATAHLMSHRGRGGVLNLSVPPSFAMQWLLPRLTQFKLEQPDVTLNFVRYTHTHNFSQDQELDAAIQFGEGEWPGAASDYLTGKNTISVCAPDLFKNESVVSADKLAQSTLLQHIEVPYAWQDWCNDFDLKDSNGLVGPRFDQYSLIIKAAMSGFGIGLVPACLVEEELASGQLINPFPRPYKARQGYFLCVKEDRGSIPAVNVLRAWLLSSLNEADL